MVDGSTANIPFTDEESNNGLSFTLSNSAFHHYINCRFDSLLCRYYSHAMRTNFE